MKNKSRMFLNIASVIGFAAVAQNATAAAPVIKKAEATYSTNTITITGSNLSSPSVTFHGVALTVISSTSTVVTAALPAGIGPGSYHLVVSTSGGTANMDVTLAVPSMVAYDANGHFLGLFVEGPRGPHIFIPTMNLYVQFDVHGHVTPIEDLFYTTTNCSGTPYGVDSLTQGQLVFRYQGGLVTETTAGPPASNGTIYQSRFHQGTTGVCQAYNNPVPERVPVTLTPITLPFPLPVAKPVKIVAQ